MGQSVSQPAERAADERRAQRLRHALLPLPSRMHPQDGEYEQPAARLLSADGDGQGLQRSRSRARRLSQMLRPPMHLGPPPYSAPHIGETQTNMSRNAMMGSTRNRLGDIFRRESRRIAEGRSSSRNETLPLQHRISESSVPDFYPPRLPSIDLSETFDRDAFAPTEDLAPPQPSSSSRRPSNRFNAFRPDRPLRGLTSSLRRRRPSPARPPSIRPPAHHEDQATMLSRLLSVAAAATAATLMGDDHQAFSEARSLTGGSGLSELSSSGEDGSFDGFLRALQNGRIASALRQGSAEPDGETREAGPLNFFRMFRFGSPSQVSATADEQSTTSQDLHQEAGQQDTRLVPIIIVGIRSISPGSNGANTPADDLPPFIEALGNFPSPLPANSLAHGQDSIDSILRPPQNSTSFRHRRRANSMSAFGLPGNRRRGSGIDDRLDDQRSPDRRRERPWSVASTASTWDGGRHAPPATPASPTPELSRISSRHTTPSHSRPASFVANSMRDFTGATSGDSRRNSIMNRPSLASPLSSHTEESVSLHSAHSSTNLLERPSGEDSSSRYLSTNNLNRRSDMLPNVHYPRFASGHPRRNGVVEPDHLPPLSRTSTSAANDAEAGTRRGGRSHGNDSRSWIIYVLGGSYPENHPILTTPSLFTENPTYEDMMLLSALLGPAKPPVASEEDVQSAGGIFHIEVAGDPDRETALLQASMAADVAKSIELVAVEVAAEDAHQAHSAATATNPFERLPLEPGQRCLVCLSEFEAEETARKLVKCKHLFHKECIDHWLTQGRNSCPLCRGQGVDEKAKAGTPSSADEPDATAGAQEESTRAHDEADEIRRNSNPEMEEIET